ncbi:hypothetical protein BTIS_1108 [Bifidobacterium tissieri]|uniref:Uncharacterized protein n=1 Tax=Bifidobacterium tissieri TaxID=1630162 RepID=A0A261FFF9_9BIFI|nr:hypothetical protein [Bifidobacterium tissieri]OZG57867.1 hypothetical protein BTIS_1108 [Bifidobacterium tissieri]
MLALQAYEARLCPVCGMDSRICHDETRFQSMRAKGRVEVCFARYERNRALDEYRGSGQADPLAEGAITVGLTAPPPDIFEEDQPSWR